MAIAKLILCASNQRMIAGIWFGTRLHFYETYENTEEGYVAFTSFIQQHKNLNAYLIADAIEEEYRLETLPHTSGKARKELLERKLNQFNRNNLFRTAHFIGQDQDKRKDDNFLFAALSNAEFLQGWMSIIQSNQIALVGLYLLPMMSQFTVQQMKLMAPNILLCERLSSGLRQTYLNNGHIRMSRLAPMIDVKPNQMAYFYLVEIEKTRLYLLSQRFISDTTDLQLVIPSSDTNSEVIGQSISQEQGMECRIVNSLAYAKNINISPDLVAKHPELLHMQLLANGNVPDNLAPPQLTKNYLINKIRRAIYVTTGAVSLLGLSVAGYSLMQAGKHIQEYQQLAQATADKEKKYEQVAKNFPNSPFPSQDLQAAVSVAQTLKSYQVTPSDMMFVLSEALQMVPEIGIQRLHWVHTTNVNISDVEASDNLPITEPSAQGAVESLRQVGFVDAELLNFGGDYRAALASVMKFSNQLRAQPKVEEVVVLQEPVNVSSFANLQGSTKDEGTTERAPAIFKLKIVLKQSARLEN